MNIIPRYYQNEAINAIFNFFYSGKEGNPLVVAPTGSGKSIMISLFCQIVTQRWPGQKILLISHVKEILEQDYATLKKHLKTTQIGLYSSGLKSRTIKDITVAGIQSVYKKPELFDDFNIIIVDECFAPGTKILTEYGDKNIEDIKIGDTVLTAIGLGSVESTFKKKTNESIILELTNGKKIECTKNHKFFTEDGWCKAENLEGKRIINHKDMCTMQKRIFTKTISNRITKGITIQKTRMLFKILLKEIKKPYALRGFNSKNERYINKNWTQTKNKRWKWDRWISNRKYGIQGIRGWVDPRTPCGNKNETLKNWLSNILQNRCSKPKNYDRNRIGWKRSWVKIKAEARQKKEDFFGISRVENISHKKFSSPRVVYDLQVSNHPSYYADECLVHNCHTIPLSGYAKKGMYHKFFDQVKRPVIGFTATPFRLGSGYLHLGEGAFFDDIVYNIPIKTLQAEGHLCPITAKGTKRKLDATGIKKQGGDFALKELSMAFDRDTITGDIVDDLCNYKELRKHWLLFAIDIDHAENITNKLIERGIKAATVHSRMEGDRDQVISDFKAGVYQCLVSVAVLTTGFDAPFIDLIGLLRPTASPVLHLQIIGRGLRTHPGKENCLVLDYAGNLMRLGPIDSPVIKLKGKGDGEAIMKECPNCFEIVHAAVRICPCCNHKFQFKHKLTSSSANNEVLTLEEWHPVTEIEYDRYVGRRKIPMLRVKYICGMRVFKDFVCFEHSGYPKHKAGHWWKRRSDEPIPDTSQQAIELCESLKEPKSILVEESGQYPSIKGHEF